MSLFLICIILCFYFSRTSSGTTEEEKKCKPYGAHKIMRCTEISKNPNYPEAKFYTYDRYLVSDRIDEKITKIKRESTPNKYYLSLMSMFKNEAEIMKEWLDHHLGHGVDHFYLVDDNSDDNYGEILKPYIQKKLVTMFSAPPKSLQYRQVATYNKVLREIMVKNYLQVMLSSNTP